MWNGMGNEWQVIFALHVPNASPIANLIILIKKYMEEIKITKEMFKDVKFEFDIPQSDGYIVSCDCGDPDCTGEKIILADMSNQ